MNYGKGVIALVFALVLTWGHPIAAAVISIAPANSGELEAAALPLPASEQGPAATLSRKDKVLLALLQRKLERRANRRHEPARQPAALHSAVPADARKTDKSSLWSFILGIGSLPLMAIGGLGLASAVAAIILGIVGLNKIQRSQGSLKGKGFAWAGLILGSALILTVVIAVATFFANWM